MSIDNSVSKSKTVARNVFPGMTTAQFYRYERVLDEAKKIFAGVQLTDPAQRPKYFNPESKYALHQSLFLDVLPVAFGILTLAPYLEIEAISQHLNPEFSTGFFGGLTFVANYFRTHVSMYLDRTTTELEQKVKQSMTGEGYLLDIPSDM